MVNIYHFSIGANQCPQTLDPSTPSVDCHSISQLINGTVSLILLYVGGASVPIGCLSDLALGRYSIDPAKFRSAVRIVYFFNFHTLHSIRTTSDGIMLASNFSIIAHTLKSTPVRRRQTNSPTRHLAPWTTCRLQLLRDYC